MRRLRLILLKLDIYIYCIIYRHILCTGTTAPQNRHNRLNRPAQEKKMTIDPNNRCPFQSPHPGVFDMYNRAHEEWFMWWMAAVDAPLEEAGVLAREMHNRPVSYLVKILRGWREREKDLLAQALVREEKAPPAAIEAARGVAQAISKHKAPF